MTPLIEYENRLDRWRGERQLLERLFIRIGNWRLTLGLLEALLAWLALGSHVIPSWPLLVPVLVFIPLVVWHQHIIRRRTLAERAIKFYEGRLARLDGHWMGTGPTGDEFRSADHVYADDLDVFGKGSLFELCCTCRLAAGERRLANWFLAPAARDQVLARQQAVMELSTRLDLREEIALLGEDMRAEVHEEALQSWGSMSPVTFFAGARLVAAALAIAGPVALLAFLGAYWPLWPFLTILAGDLLLGRAFRSQVARIIHTLETPAQGLRLLSLLLARLENEPFESPSLKTLRSALQPAGLPASKRIARLERWIDWLDSSDHLLVRIIAPVLLWREQLAMAVEAWRRESGQHVSSWVQVVAHFEALSSLAALAFERPSWQLPALLEAPAPHFEARALQHPLLPPSKCVPNDLLLDAGLRLLIVSGSNMSGKSTLLRAVGLNSVLASAGAPVAATSLRISALQPAASIRVNDSLQDNKSRFLAEITRLREIIDLTKRPPPVLFLLDELLSGTNSHDRRIGAARIVHTLVEAGAIGLITTHDLALAQIEEDLGKAAANVHFEDQMQQGRIEFEYQLRPGVVTRSNALELMRLVGLEI